jgi:hypothetical protein
MLKKIILVAALTVASFVSVNIAARTAAAPTAPASQQLASKYPPCDPWAGGGCASNN